MELIGNLKVVMKKNKGGYYPFMLDVAGAEIWGSTKEYLDFKLKGKDVRVTGEIKQYQGKDTINNAKIVVLSPGNEKVKDTTSPAPTSPTNANKQGSTPLSDANQAKKDAFEEKKQLLIVRQNCLGHAVDIARINQLDDAPIALEAVLEKADKLVNYVYNGLDHKEDIKTDAGIKSGLDTDSIPF